MKIIDKKVNKVHKGFLITELTAIQYFILNIFLGLLELAFYRDDKRFKSSTLVFFNSNTSERNDSISYDKAHKPL